MKKLLLILLASCSSAPMVPLPPQATAEQALNERSADRALSDTIESAFAPASFGVVRVIEAKTACQSVTGINPMVWLPKYEPKVGQPLRILWTTRAMAPFPADMAWMIVSHRNNAPAPVDFTPYGMPGCWLMVDLDISIALSTGTTGIFNRPAGSGRINMEWVPPTHLAGQTVRMQMLVVAPGENRANLLSSPAIEIIFGT